jgi:hypothetical protein
MDTPPDSFCLETPTAARPTRSGFRVPFGLRDGRAWAPSEVGKGKACGCVCPGCLAPLSAKAQDSRRKRPHFAHLTDTGCATGRETGIHLRAKQLIADKGRLLLPSWDGHPLAMPNPPRAQDDDGQWHNGRRVDLPGHTVALQGIEVERSFGIYTPDVSATDPSGTLLIEIRVTHAVDDRKAARVDAHGHRMVEIDLSRLDRHTPHDLAAFEHAVLSDPKNRDWIVHPEGIREWQAAKAELDRQIAERNAWIADQRQKAAQAEKERRQRAAREDRDRAEKKEFVRKRERAKHSGDLERLAELTHPARVAALLDSYRQAADERIEELLEVVPPAVRVAALRWHADAWVFGTHPVLWQLLAHKQFVADRSPGHRFNQRDVASWVRRTFPSEGALYRLFVAQYAARAEARRAGFSKRSLDYWVFTPEENSLIPDFYGPVNEFISRLESAQVIRLLPAPVGECEVLPPPPTGHYPTAFVMP